MSALAATAPTRNPRKSRSKARHAAWVSELQVAQEMGVEVRNLCGVWTPPFDPTDDDVIGIIEGAVADLRQNRPPQDCRRCDRIYGAYCRRNLPRWIEEQTR